MIKKRWCSKTIKKILLREILEKNSRSFENAYAWYAITEGA